MIEIRWHGRGGQGSFTASRLLGLSASVFENRYALAFPSFGPERRGAPVLAFTKIDDKKITDRSEIKKCDYIIILDDTLMSDNIFDDLKENGIVFINTKHPEKYLNHGKKVVTIDAATLALDILGRNVTNTAMIGALIGKTGIISLSSAEKGIRMEMKPVMADKNICLLRRAYEVVKEGSHAASNK